MRYANVWAALVPMIIKSALADDPPVHPKPHHEFRCVQGTTKRCLEHASHPTGNLTKVGCEIVGETHCRANPRLPAFAPSADLVNAAFRWSPPGKCKEPWDRCKTEVDIPYFNLPICGSYLDVLCPEKMIETEDDMDVVAYAKKAFTTEFHDSLSFAWYFIPGKVVQSFERCLAERLMQRNSGEPDPEPSDFFYCLDCVKQESASDTKKLIARNHIDNRTHRKIPAIPHDVFPMNPPDVCRSSYEQCMARIKSPILDMAVCLTYLENICQDALDKNNADDKTRSEVQRVANTAQEEFGPALDAFRRARPLCTEKFNTCMAEQNGDFYKCLAAAGRVCKIERQLEESREQGSQGGSQ